MKVVYKFHWLKVSQYDTDGAGLSFVGSKCNFDFP